ncbi:MAG: rhodanese-like domain-containing protein [Opitutae bacterium]|jgi:rhodanese-related sulfurtransferase|nr:rhodanese-like domain-containing protein [Opitutae bacterium]
MARFFREISFIIAISVLGAAFSLFSGLAPLPWAEPGLAAGEIWPADARALQVIWIDARNEADYHTAHIPSAIYLNDEHWETGIIELMDAWLTQPRPIVVYCGSEGCGTSKRIAEHLRDTLPDAEIYSLKGGWDAWLQ